MTQLTQRQLALRNRIEGLIRLLEPALNLVLATGEAISRVAEPERLKPGVSEPTLSRDSSLHRAIRP
ncbi:MAG TPA: hypothetical protein VHE14_02915 [Solirubrobacteraceae bacterium]|nr:hypothetical protein [Solirubrobacteraceae bacterium]